MVFTMSNLIPVIIDDQTIYVEVERTYGSEETTSLDEVRHKVEDAFEHAKTTITSVAKSMAGSIRSLDQALAPHEFVIEFAIKFNAEGQAILAKAGAEASLKITLNYKHK
jgi:hypothetical protein